MPNASSASSATTAVMVTTNVMTGRVPQGTKTRTTSPVASMASTPSLYKGCHANPRNQAKLRTNNNKRRHKSSHYNDNRYTSSNDESRRSAHTPMPSNGNASARNESKAKENFYLSEGRKNKKRRSGNVPSSSHSRKSDSTSKKHGTSKKHQNSDNDLDWDKTFKDAFVTDVEVADLKNGIQIENPLVFGK
jgi:hypothetical protein